MNEPEPHPPRTDRLLLIILAGIVGVVAVSLIVILGVGSRRPAPPEPGTPVAATLEYLDLLRNGEAARAYDMLSTSGRSEISRERFLREAPRFTDSERERRVVAELIRDDGERAEVRVTVSVFTSRSDPFSRSSRHSDTTIRLVREGGDWRIASPAAPYQIPWW